MTQLGTLMSITLTQVLSHHHCLGVVVNSWTWVAQYIHSLADETETGRAVATVTFVALNLALLVVHLLLIGRPLLVQLKETVAILRTGFSGKEAESDSEVLEKSAVTVLDLEPSLVQFNCSGDGGDTTPYVVVFQAVNAQNSSHN